MLQVQLNNVLTVRPVTAETAPNEVNGEALESMF
jgi:hypothetical protein